MHHFYYPLTGHLTVLVFDFYPATIRIFKHNGFRLGILEYWNVGKVNYRSFLLTTDRHRFFIVPP